MALTRVLEILGLILSCSIIAHGKRNFLITLSSCNITENPKFISAALCTVERTSDIFRANFDVQMHYEVKEAEISFNVFFLKKDESRFTILNSTNIDACQFLEGKLNIPILKIMRNVLLNNGALPSGCPIQEDYHYIYSNVTIDADHFPPYAPETTFVIQLTIRIEKEFAFYMELVGDIKSKSKSRWG